MKGSTSQAAGGAEERDGVDAHHLERVDLVADAHRAELSDDPGPDLRGHHVPKGVGDDLPQITPRGEHTRIRRRTLRLEEVGALDPTLQAEDEHQRPDDQPRGDDQDPRLPQALPEEAEDAQAPHVAHHSRAEATDLADGGEELTWDREKFVHRRVPVVRAPTPRRPAARSTRARVLI